MVRRRNRTAHARRDISAAEITRAFIARIEAVNPQLNAVVVPRFEQAIQEAAAADERQCAGVAGGAARRADYRQGMLLFGWHAFDDRPD